MGNLVSIVMANYNKGKYIEDSIVSIINQDYQNFELVIIDDGSTDNSLEVIERYATLDKRIHYVSCKHKGKISAFNYGVSLAKGDYIKIWASDDVLFRNAISTMIQQIIDYDLVCHNCAITEDNLEIISGKCFCLPNNKNVLVDLKYVINGFSIPSGLYMFKKKTAKSIFPIPDEASYEDWYITMMIVYKKFNINYYDKSLAFYRQVLGSAYGGVNNYSRKTYLYRLKRNLVMLDLFSKILPAKYNGLLEVKTQEYQLILDGDFKNIISCKLPAILKLKILTKKYFYYMWVRYVKCKKAFSNQR